MQMLTHHHFSRNHFHQVHDVSQFSWDGLLTLGTFLAVLVALFGERMWKWLTRPILEIEFDRTSDRCFRAAHIKSLSSIESRKFFRLKVANIGRGTAHSLKAKVEIFDVTADHLATPFEPSSLLWITHREIVDLSPGEEEYLNLLSQSLDTAGMMIHIGINTEPARGITSVMHPRPYIFRITFHAEDLAKPVTKFYKFIPGGEREVGDLQESDGWK